MHRSEIFERLLNVSLRLGSAGSRFALLLVLAKLMSPADVGRYGLFLSTVLLGVALMGLEFHAYGLRELMRAPRDRWSFVVQHCMLAWLLAYIVLTPLLWISSDHWLVEGTSAAWLFAVMAAEHLCQETSRLIVAMGRPVLASALMFLRMGAWALVVIPWMWLDPEARRLDLVFQAWFAGAMTAFFASALVVRREARPWRAWRIEWRWIRRGIGVAAMYLVGTFVFRWIFTADRYIVQLMDGAERLGVYVLYIGLATSVITILEPAVVSFLHPRLVSAWQHGNQDYYEQLYGSLKRSVLAVSTALVIFIAVFAPLLVTWIGKPGYYRDYPLLWTLLAMVWIYSNSIPLDSALYAHRRDRSLMYVTILTMLLFLLTIPAMAAWIPGYAVAGALLLAFFSAYIAKWYLLRWKAFSS
jgi:O-antigen/teichoic acid export membrane protein